LRTDDFGLHTGQRLALYLPNDLRAVIWIAAAKRAGVPYAAIASGTASVPLAERLVDTAAALIVSSHSLAAARAQEALRRMDAPPAGVLVPPAGVLTSPLGRDVDGWTSAAPALQLARTRLHALVDGSAIDEATSTTEMRILALWQLMPPQPVGSCFPLFILHTSGSTGKPKGIVHTHGGYEVGLCLTSHVVFRVQSLRDVLLVIATPGWITVRPSGSSHRDL